MKVYISTAARKRDYSLQKIDEMADVIAQHIVYCFLYTDNDSRKHWIGEITTKLERVFLLTKSKSGTLKRKHVHEVLFNYVLEDIDELFTLCRLSEGHMLGTKSRIDYRDNKILEKLYAAITQLYGEIEDSFFDQSFFRPTCAELIGRKVKLLSITLCIK